MKQNKIAKYNKRPNETGLGKVASDLSEVGFDQLLEDGVFKDIPIIGSAIGLFKAGRAIRDQLFAKKMMRFLLHLEDIPYEEREEESRKIAEDAEYSEKVGDTLLLTIDQLNDMGKPILIARAFRAFLTGKISYFDFKRYAEIISGCNLVLLRYMHNFQGDKIYNFSSDIVLTLIGFGLAEQCDPPHILGGEPIKAKPGRDIYFIPTEFGKKFTSFVIKKEDFPDGEGQ